MGCEKRNMKINKALFQRNICTVLFFGCLFCSSMYLFEMYNGFVSGIMLLFFSAMLYVFGTKSFVKKFFIQYLFVIGTIILSMFFNKSFESIDYRILIVVTAAFLAVTSMTFDEFIAEYKKCIFLIAIVSVVLYSLFKISPQLFNRMPTYTWRYGSARFVNLWLTVVPVSMGDYFRNFGIFYEPGIFQFYLNLAIIFELFKSEKINVFKVLILSVAVITTLSTNGYITLVLIFFVYALRVNTKTKEKKKHNKKVTFFIIVTILLIVFLVLLDQGIIGTRVFNKFVSTKESGSFYDRSNAISYALKKSGNNPLLGVAARGIFDAYNVTFTPLNWLMMYGIVIEVIAMIGFSCFFINMTEKKWSQVALGICAFSSILSQDLSFEWIIWCLIFGGFKQLNSNSKISLKEQ